MSFHRFFYLTFLLFLPSRALEKQNLLEKQLESSAKDSKNILETTIARHEKEIEALKEDNALILFASGKKTENMAMQITDLLVKFHCSLFRFCFSHFLICSSLFHYTMREFKSHTCTYVCNVAL
jgi:hypothetical protein